MRIWVYSVCYNEIGMIRFYLRHYAQFASKIVIWDEHSDDGTRDIIKQCPMAELRDWPFKGMDDDKFLLAYDEWTREAKGKADWVMAPDIDELIYHPDVPNVLRFTTFDVLPATGYAVIGNGPVPDGDGQIYDYIKTGYPQENYTKWITWRANVEINHTHGRHDVPRRCTGRVAKESPLKLLHCHFITPDYALQRNRRSWNRHVNPHRFTWNYTPEQEAIKARGTHTWAQDLIDNNKLINVI